MARAREVIIDSSPCDLAKNWGIHPKVAEKVFTAAMLFDIEARVLGKMGKPEVKIISGYRTKAEQDALRRSGRPAARDDLSTHRSCPATGVDISLGAFPSLAQKIAWGRNVMQQGLRWGGGSPLDSDPFPAFPGANWRGGIPEDWQHVDLGPRQRPLNAF